ncbi:peroxiredoxin [Lachnospiraceae bacterium oral taxon 500]|nr:peroxiredoxin [Lachnospiraceae bacterium oral taxon 500]
MSQQSSNKRLAVGDIMPDFSFHTPFTANLTLADTVRKAAKTVLLFLRYYGCPVCQYDIHRLAENYQQITAAGGQALVVLQSDPAGLAAQLQPDSLPFEIICDPDARLYKSFDIRPAASKAQMIDADTMVKIAKAKAAGCKHGAYEGEELQLPAAFILDQDRHVLYAHYGKSVSDTPDAHSLAELLK